MSDKQTISSAINEFVEWLFIRFIIPIIPILIEALLATIVRDYKFPNESILMIGVMFPLITILETSNKYAIILLVITSLSFELLYITLRLTDLGGAHGNVRIIHWLGLYLLVAVIAFHIIPKIVQLAVRLRSLKKGL